MNAEPADFSIIAGGPLFQLWRRIGLAGDGLQRTPRRLLALTLLAWLPLLVLSMAEGTVWGDGVKLTFARDLDTHTRLLLALPVLIVAEGFVHLRLKVLVGQFLSRGLIPEEERGKFGAAVESARRLRNSMVAEVLLIVLTYVAFVFVWRHTNVMLEVASWYRIPTEAGPRASLAGRWLAFVSLPLSQFLMLRWWFRLVIWARFLWQLSRISLKCLPTHPDRSGGLGFLSRAIFAFAPLALARGVALAGMIANRILYANAKLSDFAVEMGGLGALMLLVIIGPLLVFVPKLVAARTEGLREYGNLAQRYVREFDGKWVRGAGGVREPLLGSADIQSMADLDSSYTIVKEMSPVPFSKWHVLLVAAISAAPLAPLLLTMIPMEELLERLLKVLF